MKIVNLTPHELNIYDEPLFGEDAPVLVASIPPSGEVARVIMGSLKGGNILAESTSRSFGKYIKAPIEVTPLPPKEKGTIFVVSGMYRSVNSRHDVYQPGELLRDEKGRVIGCVGLSQ